MQQHKQDKFIHTGQPKRSLLQMKQLHRELFERNSEGVKQLFYKYVQIGNSLYISLFPFTVLLCCTIQYGLILSVAFVSFNMLFPDSFSPSAADQHVYSGILMRLASVSPKTDAGEETSLGSVPLSMFHGSIETTS